MINNLSTKTALISYSKCTNNSCELTADEPSSIIAANPKRVYVAIVNNSNNQVTLIFGKPSTGSLEKGIPLNPLGGSYEINTSNLYRGEISAISSTKVKLSWVECIE